MVGEGRGEPLQVFPEESAVDVETSLNYNRDIWAQHSSSRVSSIESQKELNL